MKKLLIILILTYSNLFGQITLEINTRSPKIDTVFDYYFGLGVKDTLFNRFKSSAFGVIERERGVIYYQYKITTATKFFKLSHLVESERDIVLNSANLFYTHKNKKSELLSGLDFSFVDTLVWGGYLSFQYKFITIETAFNKTIYKLQYIINPEFPIKGNAKIGVIIKGLLLREVFTWQNGLTLKLKF